MTGAGSPVARVLAWEGCHNVRDVGGLPTHDGRVTRFGVLIRSDMLCRLTESGQQALFDHGVRTIIDMRTPDEVARDGDAYAWRLAQAAREHGLEYRHLSFTVGFDDGAWSRMHATYSVAASREQLNRLDLVNNAAGVTAIVTAIADAEPGGVVVHCHAGKDRTGLVIAVALSAVGVGDDDIADDYAITALNLKPLISDWLLEMSDDPAERARLHQLAVPRREAMLDTLAHLRERYGSAERYLLETGATADQLERLRLRLVEG